MTQPPTTVYFSLQNIAGYPLSASSWMPSHKVRVTIAPTTYLLPYNDIIIDGDYQSFYPDINGTFTASLYPGLAVGYVYAKNLTSQFYLQVPSSGQVNANTILVVPSSSFYPINSGSVAYSTVVSDAKYAWSLDQSHTASYAYSASYINGNSISASYALTASYASNISPQDTASYAITASYVSASNIDGTVKAAITASFVLGPYVFSLGNPPAAEPNNYFLGLAGGMGINNGLFGNPITASSTVTGVHNTAYGFHTLIVLVSGSENSAFGSHTISRLVSGSFNSAFGGFSMAFNLSGSYHTAFGYNALLNIKSGSNNIAIGQSAGTSYTFNESNNILIGNTGSAGENNIIRIGDPTTHSAVYIANIFTCDGVNISIGNGSQAPNAGSNNNVAIGINALASNQHGDDNMVMGSGSMLNSINASQNVAIGFGALPNIITGQNNIVLGYLAGTSYTFNETNNILIASSGSTGENGIIRIGSAGTQTSTYLVGGVNATSFTGSLQGTASWASSASYATNAGNAYAINFVPVTATSASWVSASAFITTAQTASYVTASNIVGTVTSASYALTSSYAVTASVTLPYFNYATNTTNSANWITCSFLNPNQYITLVNTGSYSFTQSNMPGAGQMADVILNISHSSYAFGTSSITFPANWGFLGSSSAWPTQISGSNACLWIRGIGTSIVVGTFTS